MCDNSSISLLEEMKEARYTSASAFTEFVNCKKFHKDNAFCFYEGEDGKYYNKRIKEIIGNQVIEIIVGDKSNVIKLWERFKQDTVYKDVIKMFFVDRDMDDIPTEIDDDLYITPCYSIENLYANETTFLNVIETEFMINKCDNDYKICKDMFNYTFKKFCDEMIDFNGLVMIRKNKGISHNLIDFSEYKISKMVEVTLDDVVRKSEYDCLKTELLAQMNSCEQELSECIRLLIENNNYVNDFRGKQQLDFLVKQIENLKLDNDKLCKLTKKRNNIKICITKNRLSELSMFAITPQCLIDFISKHKILS